MGGESLYSVNLYIKADGGFVHINNSEYEWHNCYFIFKKIIYWHFLH